MTTQLTVVWPSGHTEILAAEVLYSAKDGWVAHVEGEPDDEL